MWFFVMFWDLSFFSFFLVLSLIFFSWTTTSEGIGDRLTADRKAMYIPEWLCTASLLTNNTRLLITTMCILLIPPHMMLSIHPYIWYSSYPSGVGTNIMLYMIVMEMDGYNEFVWVQAGGKRYDKLWLIYTRISWHYLPFVAPSDDLGKISVKNKLLSTLVAFT